MSNGDEQIAAARKVVAALGMPRGQQNQRTALCLLAVLDLRPGMSWAEATEPLIGITPIMDWALMHYGRKYAPNSRESFRRRSIHQFRDAGILLCNPDDPKRATNSQDTVYKIAPEALALMRAYGTGEWEVSLHAYIARNGTLAAKYSAEREQEKVPVVLEPGESIMLSPGEHSELIAAIVTEFAARFTPGSKVLYVGDTAAKHALWNKDALHRLGVDVDEHGKMPDVVLHFVAKNWLVLVEAVTSHGPVNGKRHGELKKLFASSKAGLVFVTAFPDRATMGRYLGDLAWETEVWVADSPSHLIHFNGERFLGPYPQGTVYPAQQDRARPRRDRE